MNEPMEEEAWATSSAWATDDEAEALGTPDDEADEEAWGTDESWATDEEADEKALGAPDDEADEEASWEDPWTDERGAFIARHLQNMSRWEFRALQRTMQAYIQCNGL